MGLFTFEVHTFAPELNKVFINGVNVSKNYQSVLSRLIKDYNTNIRLIRQLHKTPILKTWQLTAERPNGTIETRFCAVKTIGDVLSNWYDAKSHYNLKGTKLTFKPYFKY